MKKRKFISFVIVIMMVFSSTSFVNAATNPYPYWNDDAHTQIACTYVAWQQVYNNLGVALPLWGHAGTWLDSAKGAGIPTGSTPQVGAVAVWSGGVLGHVGYVTGVSGGNISTIEGGLSTVAQAKTRPAAVGSHPWGGATLLGYIYPKGGKSGNDPIMALDICENNGDGLYVRGWAFDLDNKSQQIEVHVYIGGEAGSGAEVHAIKANTYRPDVNSFYSCGEYHGFDSVIKTSISGIKDVYVYAINVGKGNHSCEVRKSINIGSDPIGSFDAIASVPGYINVYGWAFDLDNPSKQVAIHVYIGGEAGQVGAEGHNGDINGKTMIANILREDVDKAYASGKYHGFNYRVPTNLSGTQPVYVYAINIGNGRNSLIGCKNIDIKLGFTINDVSANDMCFTGKALKPSVKIKKGSSTLIQDLDYSLAYSNNMDVGNAKITITGKGNYSGTVTKTFKINPKGTKVKSLVKAKKAFTVKWSKQSAKMSTSRITGYQIQYSTSSKFASGNKTIKVKGYAKTSKKISKLKAKKKYYVRVRTYKTINGNTFYSTWSPSKSVLTK